MRADKNGAAKVEADVPSILDLIRLSRRPLFPPGGVDLCRQIALLTDMRAGDEVLVVPAGLAVTLEYFVSEYDVVGSGVEGDPSVLERAEKRLRSLGILDRVHIQPGRMDALPFRDGIFDVVVAELGLTSRAAPDEAAHELVRVAKPGSSVVIVQPVWKAPVGPERRAILSQHLGCRPLMVVEWKRLLMDAGLKDLHTENWSDEETAFRPQVRKPFPDFTELFSASEKLGILRRARHRWGWAGVWTALAREREVHKVLTRERILGLDLVKGVKRSVEAVTTVTEPMAAPVALENEDPGRAREVGGVGERQVTGLPLFDGDTP